MPTGLNQAYRSLPDYLPMESRGYRGNWGNTDGVTDICYNRESAYVSGSLKASYEIGFPYYPNSTTQNIGNPAVWASGKRIFIWRM